MLILGYLFALIIGLTLGMLGGGGSILTVPVFVYVLGFEPKLAVAMSLPVVAATSFVGAVSHWRAGSVRLRSALAFGGITMTAAFAGARASALVSGRAQLVVLGVAMLVAAVLMLRDSVRAPGLVAAVPAAPAAAPAAATPAQTAPGAPTPSLRSRLTLPAAGLFIGALTGSVGIGGGFLILPALVLLARTPMREAVGTSLTVITMSATAGFAGQHRLGEIPLGLLISFTGVAIAGIVAGSRLAARVRQQMLKRAFALLLLVIAVLILWQNRALI